MTSVCMLTCLSFLSNQTLHQQRTQRRGQASTSSELIWKFECCFESSFQLSSSNADTTCLLNPYLNHTFLQMLLDYFFPHFPPNSFLTSSTAQIKTNSLKLSSSKAYLCTSQSALNAVALFSSSQSFLLRNEEQDCSIIMLMQSYKKTPKIWHFMTVCKEQALLSL